MSEIRSACAYTDQVSSFALGELAPSDRELFEKHLSSGCPTCAEELEWTRETLADLGTLSAAAPPASLRDRILGGIGSKPQTPGVVLRENGILGERPDEIPWKPMHPGIEFKTLHTDRDRKCKTLLIRMEAGVVFPKHRHKEVEEIYLISGDLRVGDTVLRSGDYCRSEADSIHEAALSETGCTFFVMASQHNEFFR